MTKHMISIYLDAFTPVISGDRDSTGEFYFVTRSGMDSHRWPIEKELKLEAGVKVKVLSELDTVGTEAIWMQLVKSSVER